MQRRAPAHGCRVDSVKGLKRRRRRAGRRDVRLTQSRERRAPERERLEHGRAHGGLGSVPTCAVGVMAEGCTGSTQVNLQSR